jgi:hypothetical protein
VKRKSQDAEGTNADVTPLISGEKAPAAMPIFQYLFGVGGVLLCLMFVLDAYVPRSAPREQRDLDKSTIRITTRPTGDFVIDHFPSVRNDLALAPDEAVRRALAMMPDGDTGPTNVATTRSDPATPASPRKRRVAQRPQPRLPNGEPAPPPRSQAWAGNGWSDRSWSQDWSRNGSQNWWNGSSGNGSSNWTNGSNNRWTNNRWAAW